MNHIKPPVLGLRIGIVGNRDLTGVDEAQVRQSLDGLFRTICSETEAIWRAHCLPSTQAVYANEPPQFTLINSLAEGADQLVAEVVRALPYSFRLSCPIPFPSSKYKQLFSTSADRENFDRLVADEQLAPVIIEMDCSADTPKQRQQGYRAAADMLLDNTDILVALYDPEKVGDTGGSLDTTEIAVQRRIPVIHLNTKNPQAISHVIKLTRFDEDDPLMVAADIQPLLETVLLPSAYRKSSQPADAGQEEDRTRCTSGMRCFFNEPLLQNTGARRRAGILYKLYAPAWKVVYGIMKLFQRSSGQDSACADLQEKESTQKIARTVQMTQAPYAQQKKQIDALASHYMDIYRGSFILNFLLGAMAVLFAVSSYFSDEVFYGSSQMFTGFELGFLVVIVATYISSRRGNWQRKAVDYRFMVEYFRHVEMLALLGRSTQLLQPAEHHHTHDPGNTWMGWYLKAFLRSQQPFQGVLVDAASDLKQRTVRLDQAYVTHVQHTMCRDWLEYQSGYHRALHGRYSAWGRVSNFSMALLFILTLCGVVLHLLPWHPAGELANAAYGWGVAVLVAALPAFLAALHGISVQGEFERLSERSVSTAGYLEDLIKRLNAIQPESSSRYTDAVGDHAVEAAQVMLEEVTDWQVLYRAHAVGLT
ncbi:hypothetical protein MNBD_GAMMA15-1490 [hydrothermal vent metagenome]|uniref:SMODS and SLOG-associating 2TM effector domain-containing protein n=1 Tax=hydrothermal vent metagenome TaxID=652676 RepID=A0A3B0ZCI8_9ZZZZ